MLLRTLIVVSLVLWPSQNKPKPVFHAKDVTKITYSYAHCRLLPEPTPTADFLCDKVGFKVAAVDYSTFQGDPK